jgi:hypothetical protein
MGMWEECFGEGRKSEAGLALHAGRVRFPEFICASREAIEVNRPYHNQSSAACPPRHGTSPSEWRTWRVISGFPPLPK